MKRGKFSFFEGILFSVVGIIFMWLLFVIFIQIFPDTAFGLIGERGMNIVEGVNNFILLFLFIFFVFFVIFYPIDKKLL